MKGLATLLRLAANRSEQARLALAGAAQARAEAEAGLRHHAETMAAEPPPDPSGDALRDWSAWRAEAGRTARALGATLREKALDEEACRESMRERLAEGKRLEIAQAAQIEALRRRDQRRREAASEEAALQRRRTA